MFKRDKFDRSSILRSRYMELDIENMSDEEFGSISKEIYISMILRGSGGIILLILCIVALVVGGKYAW